MRTVRHSVVVSCKCVGRSRENFWCGRGLRRVIGFPVAEAARPRAASPFLTRPADMLKVFGDHEEELDGE
jgi:hypothetical protein